MFEDLKGKPTTAKWEKLLDSLSDRLRLRGGKGLRVHSGENGFVISARRGRSVSVGGGGGDLSFKLSVSKVDDSWEFTVASAASSITDGTNGPAIDLSAAGLDTPTPITETTIIVLQATVTAGVASAWTIAAVDNTDSKEVGFSSETDPPADPLTVIAQNKVRLRIGKVTIEEGAATVVQYATDSQILSDSFSNGSIVKTLESHPFQD